MIYDIHLYCLCMWPIILNERNSVEAEYIENKGAIKVPRHRCIEKILAVLRNNNWIWGSKPRYSATYDTVYKGWHSYMVCVLWCLSTVNLKVNLKYSAGSKVKPLHLIDIHGQISQGTDTRIKVSLLGIILRILISVVGLQHSLMSDLTRIHTSPKKQAQNYVSFSAMHRPCH